MSVSTVVAVITALSFLLGLINQAISQGSILGGLIKVPPTWLPYLTLVATFLGGFLGSIESSSLSTINAQVVVNAVIAGLLALSSAGGGAAVALHLSTPKRTAALRAAAAAAAAAEKK